MHYPIQLKRGLEIDVSTNKEITTKSGMSSLPCRAKFSFNPKSSHLHRQSCQTHVYRQRPSPLVVGVAAPVKVIPLVLVAELRLEGH